MAFLQMLLAAASVTSVVVWAALSLRILSIQRRRVNADRIVSDALETLRRDEVKGLSVWEQVAHLRPVVQRASRELIMRATAGRDTPDAAFKPLYLHLTRHWDIEALLRDASSHRSARDKWRRTTALRILFRAEHAQAMDLVANAVEHPDADVAAAAMSLLSTSTDPRAIDILLKALKTHRQPASRVAMHIEHSPQHIDGHLLALLQDADPVVRLWAATLLARYPSEIVERALVRLTADPDPRVRKAAIQTLGTIGDVVAAECAEKLLADPFPYVRAHAARALGELGRSDLAERMVTLLGDTDWWVRLAAKESLEAMGSDVWPVLMRSLNHDDRFVRNGAAEVFQNLGVLDSLIVMEAATDNPAATKIDMLRRIAAAGGVRFTESLVERAGPIVGPRIRSLLTTIGLDHVEAA